MAGCDQQAVDHCTAPSGVRMPNEERVFFSDAGWADRILHQVRVDLVPAVFGAISGTGSWDRLLGAFDGVFRDRSASVAVISSESSECPEVTQKDHVRPEKLRLPAIESRFQV